jgi:hypothetical protein
MKINENTQVPISVTGSLRAFLYDTLQLFARAINRRVQIVNGFADPLQLGSGTANATTYLRGDMTWAAAGGGGGANAVTATVDFGASFTDKASVVVTGQTWVTVNSEIVAHVLTPASVDPDEMRLLNFTTVISDLAAGVGFTVTVYSEPEAKGSYSVMCLGA